MGVVSAREVPAKLRRRPSSKKKTGAQDLPRRPSQAVRARWRIHGIGEPRFRVSQAR
jgi:hypothetical protein